MRVGDSVDGGLDGVMVMEDLSGILENGRMESSKEIYVLSHCVDWHVGSPKEAEWENGLTGLRRHGLVGIRNHVFEDGSIALAYTPTALGMRQLGHVAPHLLRAAEERCAWYEKRVHSAGKGQRKVRRYKTGCAAG